MNEPTPPEDSRRWRWWAALGIALVAGGVIGGIIVAATSGSSSDTSASGGACPVVSVATNVLPSVVSISVTGRGGSGSGSGEVIRPDGYILTNNHVIAAAASGGSVEVAFADGESSLAAITGRDPLTDLAVLKVDVPHRLKPIAVGSSASVQVGEQVLAIGSPLGLPGTVTSGIVSAVDRTIQVPGENDGAALLASALQTDAAINPGNSGGALVDCKGDLVGVPTAGATVPVPGQSSSGSIGLGFAIPVDLAKSVGNEIIATGRVTHAFFGLQTTPVPASVAGQGGVPQGLFVQGTTVGGPSAQAGLRRGDVITMVDGKDATSNVQLQELTLIRRAGDAVPIVYWRDGQSHTATVTLTSQP
jgi:putative serine protease PepD